MGYIGLGIRTYKSYGQNFEQISADPVDPDSDTTPTPLRLVPVHLFPLP